MGAGLRIGLIGCGTVGRGVVEILAAEGSEIARKTSATLELVRVADTDTDKIRQAGVPEQCMTSDASEVIEAPDLDVVVELVGGTTVAREFVLKALAAGKHVVTANKALLAHHGKEIYAEAVRHRRCVAFESSCAGGIPIILAVRQGLVANRISALHGILNGTCNYILSEMADKGKSYAEALAEAQEAGFAEVDPTLDVNGTDTAHKLAILASIAFGVDVDFDRLHIEGIEHLDAQDLAAGQEMGYVCKLLGIADRTPSGLSLRVHPAFVREDHALAGNRGSFNAVSVYGNWVGHTLYYGRGAGSRPTASAVVADLVDIAVGNQPRVFEAYRNLNDKAAPPTYAPIDQLELRYYVRLMVVDRPGVMAQITRIFGENAISLRAVVQHEPPEGAGGEVVPVMVLTDVAAEGRMRSALAEVARMDVVKSPPVMIRVVSEHEEYAS